VPGGGIPSARARAERRQPADGEHLERSSTLPTR
jgi:hypothetical protein